MKKVKFRRGFHKCWTPLDITFVYRPAVLIRSGLYVKKADGWRRLEGYRLVECVGAPFTWPADLPLDLNGYPRREVQLRED